MRFLLCGLALLLTLAFLPQAADPPRVLDQRNGDYQEDEAGGRHLASIDSSLLRDAAGTRLTLRISALGPGVDPALGSHGLPGANHVTARELEDLHGEDALWLVLKGRQPGRWAMRPGRRGTIPELRLDPGGQLQLGVPSRSEFLLEMHGESGPLPDGRHDLYLEARGLPRLRIEVMVGPTGASILGMASLGQHHLEVHP